MPRIFLLSLVTAAALSAQNPYITYMPHLADGGAWRTIFSIANLSDNNPGSGVLRFHAEDGSALALALTNGTTTSQVPINLPPNGSTLIETAGLGDKTTLGWAQLDDQTVPSALFITAVFRERVPGFPDFEASVLALPVATKAQSFAYDNSPGFATGIAVINSSTLYSGKITVTVRDEAGKALATDTLNLPIGAHVSFAIPSQYPASVGRRGVITLAPDSLIWMNALAFRFNPTGPFTTLAPLVR